jgi:prephenate dehydrogenase
MINKIAIIGLGQIGASIGLCIKRKTPSPKVFGSDKDASTARSAKALGAVNAIGSLKSAVQDAEVVFLCLPLSQMRETLRQISPSLKDNAVVLDTAPLKRPTLGWVREFLPARRHYLGLVPAVSTPFLATPEMGIRGAHADLFNRTVMLITAPPGTPAEVEELGLNVARLLGAKPLLADITEADGLMTTAHVLPQLTAAALVEACVARPGWAEARKLAGRPFAGVTGGIGYYDDPASVEVAALANPPNVIHALDVLIAALKGLRDDIESGDQKDVGERLSQSYRARADWLDERGAAAWLSEGGQPIDVPELGERAMQMLFGGAMVDHSRFKKNRQG